MIGYSAAEHPMVEPAYRNLVLNILFTRMHLRTAGVIAVNQRGTISKAHFDPRRPFRLPPRNVQRAISWHMVSGCIAAPHCTHAILLPVNDQHRPAKTWRKNENFLCRGAFFPALISAPRARRECGHQRQKGKYEAHVQDAVPAIGRT